LQAGHSLIKGKAEMEEGQKNSSLSDYGVFWEVSPGMCPPFFVELLGVRLGVGQDGEK